MITADTTPDFPACPSYGFTVGPMIMVKVIGLDSGFERTVRKWQRAKRTFNGMPVGQRPEADIEQIYNFYLALGSSANPFRFRDIVDFKSCSISDDTSFDDQPIAVITADSPDSYRLAKIYTVGAFSMVRYITRPRGETIRISNTSRVEQPDSTWTIDENTGFLTITGGFTGTPGFWGGEFDVLTRFDGVFEVTVSNYKIQTATVNLIEKLER